MVFGAGARGRHLLKLLMEHDILVSAVIDNHPEIYKECNEDERKINLIDVCFPHECNLKGACCIVSPREDNDSICDQLYSLGADDIIKYADYREPAVYLEDKQYFDEDIVYFRDQEVFVDAGVFNLHTSLRFISECQKHHVKKYSIHAFEPDPDNHAICRRMLNQMENENIKLYPFGLWSRDETLYFQNNGSASKIVMDNNGLSVKAVSLDSCQIKPVTFIKMDIEGAELEALKGAAETIKRFKPKLAISLYHKDEDLTEIPIFIKELVPEYKLYIRHYSNMTNETVLYVVI